MAGVAGWARRRKRARAPRERLRGSPASTGPHTHPPGNSRKRSSPGVLAPMSKWGGKVETAENLEPAERSRQQRGQGKCW